MLKFFGTSSSSEKDRRYSKNRKGAEREYTVFTDKITRTEEVPIIYSYGEVKSWRTLEIRTPVVGEISEVAKLFRDGSTVVKGDFLFSIEDTEYRDNLQGCSAIKINSLPVSFVFYKNWGVFKP